METTLGLLRFWEVELQSMSWNTENEDGTMYRLVDTPHKVALKVVGFEDKELSTLMQFPASRRELLDKLQVRLAALDDRVEVKALFPIEPIYRQEFPSARGLRGWATEYRYRFIESREVASPRFHRVRNDIE